MLLAHIKHLILQINEFNYNLYELMVLDETGSVSYNVRQFIFCIN